MLNLDAGTSAAAERLQRFRAASYYEHYAAVGSFPSEASIAALERLGITHLVVHLDAYDAEAVAQHSGRARACRDREGHADRGLPVAGRR